MKLMTGTVVKGNVEVPTEVAEGTHVIVLAPEQEEPVTLTPELQEELSAAAEQIRRGAWTDGDELIAELRSRRR